MSTFFAAQNGRDSVKITLPRLGPINERQGPAQPSRDRCTITHASASVVPEIVLPRGARERKNDATTQIRLPPVSKLIAEVEAQIAGQLPMTTRISKPFHAGSPKLTTLPRVVIECQSLISRDLAGFPLHELRNWASIRPAFNLLHGVTDLEAERRLASVRPPVIGFYLAGYDHLNLAMPLTGGHNCTTIPELVFHVGVICERFIVGHCNDYQGPKGLRVGPGYVPFECVRMIRVVQVTDNYWVGVLSVTALVTRSR